MIKIQGLNKIYRSKMRAKCHALKNINLTLPDSGLVFVLGKSGSGKSTLLNLIGGLDSITSGNIIVNGNDITKFSENDFCNYRNDHVGFIFQDYHLINDLTVYENIALSIHLKNDVGDRKKVADALERVGLAGYETRYPHELSGGEQQRVAIARALVKRPHVILADEPTGNLDFLTSKAVVNILNELSRDCLILIVSHSVNDANDYADRIIELSHGEIISDREKNPEFPSELTVNGSRLLYPEKTPLSDEAVNIINENPQKDIVKINDKFLKTKEPVGKGKDVYIFDKKLSPRHKRRLSFKFLRNKYLSIFLSSFMISAIMVIVSLAETMITFSGSAMIRDEMNKANMDSIYLNKNLPDELKDAFENDLRTEIDDKDIQKIKDLGYEGKTYPIYNVTVPIYSAANTLGFEYAPFLQSIFMAETFGTIVVDEQFFNSKFGGIKYLAKTDDPTGNGVIITDYIADCILYSNSNYFYTDYNTILGLYHPSGWHNDGVFISGIIDTGYKTRHKAVVDKMFNGDFYFIRDLFDDENSADFMTEVYDSLGFSYSLNPDFEKTAHTTRNFFSTGNLLFDGTHEYVPESPEIISFISLHNSVNLKEGEACMSRTVYNSIFGTNYDATNVHEFVPHKVTLSSYKLYDTSFENPLYTIEITIAALSGYSDILIFNPETSQKYQEIMGQADTYVNSLYLYGTEGLEKVIDTAYELDYSIQGYIVSGIRSMTNAVEVFIPMFELVAMILCAGTVLIILSFASKMIKDKMHDIGILKALGTKNGTISAIFGLQIFLIAFLTSIMSNIGYYYFIGIANTVLYKSLRRIAPIDVVLELDFLKFTPTLAIANCIIIFALSLIALIIPLIKIKAIKPVKIIKARD